MATSHKNNVPLSPGLIGKVVSIQTFDRVVSNGDELVPESLTKYVGTLEAYAVHENSIVFRLRGSEYQINVHRHSQYMEVYPYSAYRDEDLLTKGGKRAQENQ